MKHKRTDPACAEFRGMPMAWLGKWMFDRARGYSCPVCMERRRRLPTVQGEPVVYSTGVGGRKQLGTITFFRNRETGLIEQGVVKINDGALSHERAAIIREQVQKIISNPVVIVGGDWDVKVED